MLIFVACLCAGLLALSVLIKGVACLRTIIRKSKSSETAARASLLPSHPFLVAHRAPDPHAAAHAHPVVVAAAALRIVHLRMRSRRSLPIIKTGRLSAPRSLARLAPSPVRRRAARVHWHRHRSNGPCACSVLQNAGKWFSKLVPLDNTISRVFVCV